MPEPVTLLASEVRAVTSRHTGRAYRITVNLPLGYAARPGEGWPFNQQPERWPVVYVLDGNWYAEMVTGIIRPMAWCGSTSDAIVVGVGYPQGEDVVESFRESFTRRNADLTPIRDIAEEQRMAEAHHRPTPSGDADNFLAFLSGELIPMIEADYRADPAQRILVGHSYGGLFGLCALLAAPGLFAKLVLGSPTLAYGDKTLFRREEAFAGEHKRLPADVYLFAGELEESLEDNTLTDTLRMAAVLRGRGYEGLTVFIRVFSDQNHCEVAAPGIHWGLKHTLRR